MYAKIFRQIYESSIAEKPETRFTFMDLLVLSDKDGVVDMTHESIARITNRPIEVIRATIAELEGPDPQSRTPDANGARLKRLDDHRDWGWVIINYDRFRAIANEEQKRAKTAARVQKYRQKLRKTEDVTLCNAPVTHGNAGNAMQRQRHKQEAEALSAEREPDFPECNGTPNREEVALFAEKIGLAEWKAVDWFHEMEGCGWKDHAGRQIQKWQSVLCRVRTKWQSDGCPTGPPKPNIRQQSSLTLQEKEMARLCRAAQKL